MIPEDEHCAISNFISLTRMNLRKQYCSLVFIIQAIILCRFLLAKFVALLNDLVIYKLNPKKKDA